MRSLRFAIGLRQRLSAMPAVSLAARSNYVASPLFPEQCCIVYRIGLYYKKLSRAIVAWLIVSQSKSSKSFKIIRHGTVR